MSLDQETVKRITNLARLKLDATRMEAMQHDLNSILHFIDQLNEVDTSSVEAMIGGTMTSMPFRSDQVTDGNCVDKILSNAPDVTCNMFVLPKVVE